MEDQWHIYSIHKITEGPLPTEITISGDAVGSIGPVFEPEPKYAYDPGFDSETYYHAGDTKFNSFFRLKRMCNQENTRLILKSTIWFVTRDYVTPLK